MQQLRQMRGKVPQARDALIRKMSPVWHLTAKRGSFSAFYSFSAGESGLCLHVTRKDHALDAAGGGPRHVLCRIVKEQAVCGGKAESL